MRCDRIGPYWILAVLAVLLPAQAWGQNVGFTGRVTDETGAVLPGVTVEARSPALIEQARATVTDGGGLFTIIDLRPGDYSVTFTLPGFSTVVREGVELSGAVLVTVNAQMQVGAVEETVTVTGQAPDVDIRNVVQETTLNDEVRNELPTGRNIRQMSELIPGMTIDVTGSSHDVGGTELNRGNSQIHGSRGGDYNEEFDGVRLTRGGTGSLIAHNIDPGEIEEYQYETSAISAETMTGGVRANMIPKEGGNSFSGSFFTTYTNADLQSDNTSQELIDAGLPEAAELTELRDLNLSAGGPVRADRLWWYASVRFEGAEKEQPGSFHSIDPLAYMWNPRLGAAGNVDESRPTVDDLGHEMYSGRLTWQASERNKLGFYASNHQWAQDGLLATSTISYEGAWLSDVPWSSVLQGKWTLPATNRLLLEARYTNHFNDSRLTGTREGLAYSDILGVLDVVSGTFFRANVLLGYGATLTRQHTAGASVSYVTGSHSAKFGFTYDQGWLSWTDRSFNGQVRLIMAGGRPVAVTAENGPWTQRENFEKIGLYAQDQWTIDRLTVNAGIRYDAHVGSVPSEHNFSGPGRFAPYQQWPQIDNVPNWKDISPRLGIAYDLFGDARTALKFSASRYVVDEGTAFAASVNPLVFNQQTTLGWRDFNGDLHPDDNELLGFPGSNRNFATPVTSTTADDAIRDGWGIRQNNWEFTGGVQHQLLDGLSVEVLYVSRHYRNFVVNDLLDVTPDNYDEYCVAAPSDSRLGGVSGSELCGLFDINPAQFGLTRTLRTRDTNFGTIRESWQGVDATMNFRSGNVTIQGGMSTGTLGNNREACFVVDSPQGSWSGDVDFPQPGGHHCEIRPPWRSTFKFLGTVGLPYDIDLAMTYSAIPGPEQLANWTVTAADVAAGTVRFLDPARTGFSGPTVEIPLVQPGTLYGERLHQVDLRFGKAFEFAGMRARAMLDIANVFNENTILAQDNVYGPNWLRPDEILLGRLIKPAVQFEW